MKNNVKPKFTLLVHQRKNIKNILKYKQKIREIYSVAKLIYYNKYINLVTSVICTHKINLKKTIKLYTVSPQNKKYKMCKKIFINI